MTEDLNLKWCSWGWGTLEVQEVNKVMCVCCYNLWISEKWLPECSFFPLYVSLYASVFLLTRWKASDQLQYINARHFSSLTSNTLRLKLIKKKFEFVVSEEMEWLSDEKSFLSEQFDESGFDENVKLSTAIEYRYLLKIMALQRCYVCK